MLRRKILDRLIEWKGRPHKPLVVKGPRQVGKTFIIRHFAREFYDSSYYIDFSADEDARAAFKGNLDVATLVNNLTFNRMGARITPGKTLIVMDEIQDCPDAYQALKSFSQDGRYDVVASGSLLGLDDCTLKGGEPSGGRVPLAPIGQVESVIMRSLDFEEFLWAAGLPEEQCAALRAALAERRSLDDAWLKSLDSAFREYMIVGGMPGPVSAFFPDKDFAAAARAQDSILSEHLRDITKYNRASDAEKIRRVMRSIPGQLSMDNKKFTYSRLGDDAGAEAREEASTYSWALEWVRNAGYGNFCYNLRSPSHPLEANVKPRDFKVYVTDTGLLVRMLGPEASRAVYFGDVSYNVGAVAENAVAEAILKSGMPVRYYRKTDGEDRMEIDFVLERGAEIVAVEVKSGKTRKSPSLSKAARFHRIDRRIMFGRTNVFVDGGVEHYPLFAAAFMGDILPRGDMDFGDFPEYMLRRPRHPYANIRPPPLLRA